MSLGLNPIEHICDVFGRSIAAQRPDPMTIDELKSALGKRGMAAAEIDKDPGKLYETSMWGLYLCKGPEPQEVLRRPCYRSRLISFQHAFLFLFRFLDIPCIYMVTLVYFNAKNVLVDKQNQFVAVMSMLQRFCFKAAFLKLWGVPPGNRDNPM
ncbi:hypothetical protein TNCV_3974261 [Trichonephila clavipes]|nr:hypothetical protein TNCV_3974261 [Trichonephila clavipes]